MEAEVALFNGLGDYVVQFFRGYQHRRRTGSDIVKYRFRLGLLQRRGFL